MGNFTRPIELTPRYLSEPILPGWQFSLFRVDLGSSGNPDMEEAIIDSVGSYGRQIGHVADALEAVLHKFGLDRPDTLARDADLDEAQKQAIRTFLDDVATVRTVKRNHAADMVGESGSPAQFFRT